MSRKANKTAIGMFVVGATALLVVAILAFGSGAFLKKSDKYVLFFDGSIQGLSVGAPVIFRGVKIGNVAEISLLYDPKSKEILIPVVVDVELARVKGAPETFGYASYEQFIQEGLRGRLEVENFITGQLMLSFDFYPDRPAKIYDIETAYPELPALPISPDIFKVMRDIPIKEISDNLEQVVAGINKLISSDGFYGVNSTLQEVSQTARSLRLFVEYLEQHPEAFLKGKPNSKGE
ncbi:MAG: MlaD family protein [Candidatus Omnitrophota bacterium]